MLPPQFLSQHPHAMSVCTLGLTTSAKDADSVKGMPRQHGVFFFSSGTKARANRAHGMRRPCEDGVIMPILISLEVWRVCTRVMAHWLCDLATKQENKIYYFIGVTNKSLFLFCVHLFQIDCNISFHLIVNLQSN